MFYCNELTSLLKLIIFLALVLQEIREPLPISDLSVTPGEIPKGWSPLEPTGALCRVCRAGSPPGAPQLSPLGCIGVMWIRAAP